MECNARDSTSIKLNDNNDDNDEETISICSIAFI